MKVMDIPQKRMMLGIVLMLVLALIAAAEETAVSVEPQETNKVIIMVKEETPSFFGFVEEVKEKQETVIEDVLENPSVEKVETFDTINAIVATVSEETLKELQNHPDVAAIIPDIKMNLLLEDSIPLINADDVHTTSVSGTNITGAGRGVCVIDTGIDPTHPDLQGNIVAQYCYCDNDGPCCSGGQNETFGNATDENGHGTHVAGIVAANAPAANGGNNLVGAAPQADIVAVKVFGKNSSTFLSNILKGIDFCITNKDNYSIEVITMSLGTGIFSTAASCNENNLTLANAADTAYEQGIMMIAASGNSGSTAGISLPACLPNVTAVGSTTKADAVSAFTNRNALLDVLAPGSLINSTAQRDCPSGGVGQVCDNSRYMLLSGTSMATPHVAGLIALAEQFSQQFQNRTLRIDELRVLLRNTGKKITDAGTGLTFPRIDALELIQTIQEPVKYSQFNNSFTTNFAAETLENLEALAGGTIGTADGVIQYPELNFVNLNINESVSITPGNVVINVSREPRLNATMSVTIKPGVINSVVFEDGTKCAACTVTSSTADNVTFKVTALDNYANFTVAASALLNIFDDTDAPRGSKNVTVDDDVTFFANYTNTTAPITDGACVVTIENTTRSMAYNASSTHYEHTTFFTAEKSVDWNVSCTSSETPLAAQDTITVMPFVAACKQYTRANRNIIMNASIEYGGAGTCVTIGADNITLDCGGFSLVNKNENAGTTGLSLTANNSRVRGCTITNFSTSILFDGAAGAQINGSTTNGALGITGSGGLNDLINTTTTTRTVGANTTTTARIAWPVSIMTADNNSQSLLTNITITLKNGSVIKATKVSGLNLLLTEAIYGAVDEILTPHIITASAGTYTTKNQPVNISQTQSASHTLVMSQLPAIASFDGNTTNFGAAPNLANVSEIIIEKKERGGVNFSGGKDVRGKDFDNAIKISDRMVSINTTMLGSEYNATGRVTIKNATCPAMIVAADGLYAAADNIRAAGFVCNENSSSACTDIICNDTAVSFRVNHFSSFTIEPNAQIILVSDATPPNQSARMQLNYRNATSNEIITGAVCLLTINNDTVIASFNSTTARYEHQRTLAAEGLYAYNATCDSVFFTKLSSEGVLNISAPAPNSTNNNNTNNGNNNNGGTGGGAGGTGGGASGGGGGGGGGGGAPSAPRTTTPTATPSAPAAVSGISSPGNEESSAPAESPAPDASPSPETTVEQQAETADAVTGAIAQETDEETASVLTGRIAGVGKALGLVKEDGEFSMFGLVSILALLGLGAAGLGSVSYQKITRLNKETVAHVKTGLGSFGIASDALSVAREKGKTLFQKIRQKLPVRKKHLFEEEQPEKKFEF